jgi:Flp pilus assembly protein TadD
MFFAMATLYVYALYVEEQKLARYFLCLALFALGLMAKPMLVTLPFVLLLLDYWPLGRWSKPLAPVKLSAAASERAGRKKPKQRKADSVKEKKISTPLANRFSIISSLLWEKVPFIFLTIVSSIVTFWVLNKEDVVYSLEYIPFPARVLNAIISYVSYLGKTFRPVDLAVFYPYEYPFPFWQVLVSCFILIGITIVVIYAIKKLPFLFVGWFWYLGTLIPVIGLVQVGGQAMADRYTYLPSIGIAIMLVWGVPLFFPREDMRKRILFPAGIAYLVILAVLTWQQCGYWKNTIFLFNHAIEATKDNYVAHTNLGTALLEEGKFGMAIDHFKKAVRLRPDYTQPYYNRGLAYYKLGQYQLAIEDFNEAIRLKPDYADAYNNRGIIYCKLGQYQLAIENCNEAIRLKPDYADAYNNRGITYLMRGNNDLGCRDAQEACALGNCKLLEMAKGKGDCR